MYTNWGEWFVENICSLKDELGYILEVKGVRERWLQGELYLKSTDEQKLDLDVTKILSKGSVDFYGESPEMIAELKICGSGSYSKMLNGYALHSELCGKEGFTLDEMSHHHPSEGSIFKDFCRLKLSDAACEKYMVMVVPKLWKQDALGKILENAKFPGIEYSKKTKWFDVRVFSI